VVCESEHGGVYCLPSKDFLSMLTREQRHHLKAVANAQDVFYTSRLRVLHELSPAHQRPASLNSKGCRRWPDEDTLVNRLEVARSLDIRQGGIYSTGGRLHAIGQALKQERKDKNVRPGDSTNTERHNEDTPMRGKVELRPLWGLESNLASVDDHVVKAGSHRCRSARRSQNDRQRITKRYVWSRNPCAPPPADISDEAFIGGIKQETQEPLRQQKTKPSSPESNSGNKHSHDKEQVIYSSSRTRASLSRQNCETWVEPNDKSSGTPRVHKKSGVREVHFGPTEVHAEVRTSEKSTQKMCPLSSQKEQELIHHDADPTEEPNSVSYTNTWQSPLSNPGQKNPKEATRKLEAVEKLSDSPSEDEWLIRIGIFSERLLATMRGSDMHTMVETRIPPTTSTKLAAKSAWIDPAITPLELKCIYNRRH